jgi:hypothetical protein
MGNQYTHYDMIFLYPSKEESESTLGMMAETRRSRVVGHRNVDSLPQERFIMAGTKGGVSRRKTI